MVSTIDDILDDMTYENNDGDVVLDRWMNAGELRKVISVDSVDVESIEDSTFADMVEALLVNGRFIAVRVLDESERRVEGVHIRGGPIANLQLSRIVEAGWDVLEESTVAYDYIDGSSWNHVTVTLQVRDDAS